MGFYYEHIVRPLLFRLDPEKAHDLGVTSLDYLGRIAPLCRVMEAWNMPATDRPVEAFGLQFPNAVGLAAGMDKNGRFWRAAPALGFGHVEIGTVTSQPQPGNERPRVFRYPEHAAIINRMGFNNEGAAAIAARLRNQLKHRRQRIPIGINIGKTKVVPLDEAVPDYLASFNQLVEFADYITINISSPNTPNLRRLQEGKYLDALLAELGNCRRSRSRKLGEKPTPLLVKLAPDLTFRQIDDALECIERHQLDGVVATNTTIARPQGLTRIKESGGLSGAPLHARSLEIVNYISRATAGKLPIIGVGGVDGPVSAGAMIDNGASLVQVYTGMIYRGPFIAKHIARALKAHQSSWI
jgi:dihydroorotate dehydrogenase